MKQELINISSRSNDRFTFCTELVNKYSCAHIAELGVYKGDFAQYLLKSCPGIKKYTMIDPWRNLSDWNKPANKDDTTFENFYQETLNKTDFARLKREILRGKTTEVIDQIKDGSIDFLYIDGDHTLKGITVDLINMWPKVKATGMIVGDDFVPSIWQHKQKYEPTMVFPFAVYFAEAHDVKIYGLPFGQFLINKREVGFEFIDLTNGKYANTKLRTQFAHFSLAQLKYKIKDLPFVKKLTRRLK